MKTPQIIKNAGKGAQNVLLPNRAALAQLTSGSAPAPTINDYAKKTPSIMATTPTLVRGSTVR